MRILRWLFGLIAVAVLGLGAAVLAARFGDGPSGPLPGGPLRAGELVAEPQADWGFASAAQEIELQLEAQSTSRTTWVVVRDGAAYVPCSLDFPPFKTWYRQVQTDGRAVVRIDGRRYAVTLAKVDDESTVADLRKRVAAKYVSGPRPPEGRAWFFRLDPRVQGVTRL